MIFCSKRREMLKACAIISVSFLLGFPGNVLSENKNKMLIVYFSHSGNTRKVAEQIHAFTGADMLELIPAEPYPENYEALVNLAQEQKRQNARPAIATPMPANIGDYDVIFLGYPVWDYTMPMILYTFLDKYHFPGKKIAPFSTHMGSRLADGPEQIARLCPQAQVLPGLAVRGTNASDCADVVGEWLKKLGLLVK